MSDLQLATATAVAESDCLLILGTADNPRALPARTAAERAGVDIHTLTSPHDIRPEQVDASTITLVDTSLERDACDTVTGLLDGLGPCTPVFRSVRSRRTASGPPAVAYEPAPPPR